MSAEPLVVIHPDRDLLAAAAAARLVTAVADAQAARGEAHVVLTGGTMGSAILESVAASPLREVVDWGRTTLWWGDERFLPAGDPDRNETQAQAALLDAVPLDPARVHPVPGPDRAADPDEAARWYAAQLADSAPAGHDVPEFDVLLLGVGPDAHVASLFPGHPALGEDARSVIGVRGAPKAPPERVTLTFRALARARDVWLLVSGTDKADAVGLALSGADRVRAPAGAVHGTRSTVWLLDRDAAARVPPALDRLHRLGQR